MSVFSPASKKDGVRATSLSCRYSPGLVPFLRSLNISLVLTAAEGDRVLSLTANQQELVMSVVDFDKPRGVAASGNKIALSLKQQLRLFVSRERSESSRQPDHSFESKNRREFSAQQSRSTAGFSSPDLAWGTDGLWIANPTFSCLSTLTNDGRLLNLWKPGLSSEFSDEDRCRVNGVALENGTPHYVTAMAEWNTVGGWREPVRNPGVIINVPGGEVLCRGLFSPTAPRVHNGRLWVLQACSGQLCLVNRQTGEFDVVETFPGYSTALDCHAGYGFVGLSSTCSDTDSNVGPLAAKGNLWCGLAVVDLTTGKAVEALKLLSGFESISAVAVVAGPLPTLM
ncbi:MAG: DUF4915 domain-containing protein [Planctomycetia bacterium]